MHDNNYISYAEKDEYGEILYDELLRLNLNMIQGQGILERNGYLDRDYEAFITLVDRVIKDSLYIVICISRKTVSSYCQAIEINSAMDSKKTIVYIMTDEDYTPENIPFLNGLVKYNIWLPGYDKQTIAAAVKTLASMCDF
jgi:hypothetical protein